MRGTYACVGHRQGTGFGIFLIRETEAQTGKVTCSEICDLLHIAYIKPLLNVSLDA